MEPRRSGVNDHINQFTSHVETGSIEILQHYQGHFPLLSVSTSASRVMRKISEAILKDFEAIVKCAMEG